MSRRPGPTGLANLVEHLLVTRAVGRAVGAEAHDDHLAGRARRVHLLEDGQHDGIADGGDLRALGNLAVGLRRGLLHRRGTLRRGALLHLFQVELELGLRGCGDQGIHHPGEQGEGHQARDQRPPERPAEQRAHRGAPAAATEGVLHETVGQLRERQGDQRREDAGQPGIVRGEYRPEDRDDGPVPQVDGEGTFADPPQGRDREPFVDDVASLHHARDDDGGQQGRQGDAAVVRPRRGGVDGDEQKEQAQQGETGDPVRGPLAPEERPTGGEGVVGGTGVVAGEQHGQHRAEEQAEHVGVRAEVDAGGVLTRGVQQGHQRDGGDEQHEGDSQQQRALADPVAQRPEQAGDDQRPEDAVLLLDGQRPVVRRDLDGGFGEVTLALCDLHPVVDKK